MNTCAYVYDIILTRRSLTFTLFTPMSANVLYFAIKNYNSTTMKKIEKELSLIFWYN